MTATVVRQQPHPDELLATSQGSAQFLPDGHVVVGWGAEPYVSEFDRAGKLVFDAKLPKDVDTYRAYRFPWSGRPRTRPAIAVRRRDLDENEVFASWNGATNVAAWVVLGGDEPGSLRPLAHAARDGFETEIRVPRGLSYYAVLALDGRGQTLATSRIAEPAE
jgi:hypothetical protein